MSPQHEPHYSRACRICTSRFCLGTASEEWMSVHMHMKINQVVVMYLDVEEILRPVSPPEVSVCKGILTAYSFLFFGTPRHYAM